MKGTYFSDDRKHLECFQCFVKSHSLSRWDSAVPGFTFSDMFLQISTLLPSNYVYGFGETEHLSYKHDLNFHKYGLFAKDQPPGVSARSTGYVLQAFLHDMSSTLYTSVYTVDPSV